MLWDSPAFNAGLTVGSQIVAVNGRNFDGDALKDGDQGRRRQRAARRSC